MNLLALWQYIQPITFPSHALQLLLASGMRSPVCPKCRSAPCSQYMLVRTFMRNGWTVALYASRPADLVGFELQMP
jgi:hypothetical protein